MSDHYAQLWANANVSEQGWREMVAGWPQKDLEVLLPLIDSQARKYADRARYVRSILELDALAWHPQPSQGLTDEQIATLERLAGKEPDGQVNEAEEEAERQTSN